MNQTPRQSNECLIDFLRFSLPDASMEKVADLLGIALSDFTSEKKGSPFPTYDSHYSFADIIIHQSDHHNNLLVNLSGQGCRQYEEYMSSVEGWHWQKFLATILKAKGTITRADLAMDLFDGSSPPVSTLQKYVKNGQLSSQSRHFREVNSGQLQEGILTGHTLYIGAQPQLLRIYDKKQEIRDKTGEIAQVHEWVRWELELTDQKARQAVEKLAKGIPLNTVIRGILASHYSFKTKPKGPVNYHNKARWPNMKWWDKFVGGIPKIPLRVIREKPTFSKKKAWLENATSKSLAMIYEAFLQAYGPEQAEVYLRELLATGKEKFTETDQTFIEQKILELENEDSY